MTNDEDNRTYRKLFYFYTNKIPVHFKLETGEFRNGEILDLNLKKSTIIFKEFVIGDIPILLEEINPNSISKFTEKEISSGNGGVKK